MVIKMKISFIKYKNDVKVYRIPEMLGMDIFDIENPEEIDNKIDELKDKKYTTIIIPNELASFSEGILNKYKYNNKINIVITPNKK